MRFPAKGAVLAATMALALSLPLPASNNVAYAEGYASPVNDEGEYSYIPEDAAASEETAAQQPAVAAETRERSISVVELGGTDRYETVAKEALHSYTSSGTVIVASGAGYADSIAAAGLAGALDCPILLTNIGGVPSVTVNAIKSLGAGHVILIGSEAVANASVYKTLQSLTGSVERIAGPDRYATQMEIYEYGVSHKLWTGDTAVIASATGYADALSMSPISFKLKAPVFFCNESRDLPSAQRSALATSGKSKFLLTGSETVTSSQVERWLSTLGSVKRLGGADRYETSFKIAQYAVSSLGCTWDSVAFASGQGPYDSLGGGVVQGKDNSVLLLADATNDSNAARMAQHAGSVSSEIKFFGSVVVVPTRVRIEICRQLNVPAYGNMRQTTYALSLGEMAQLQVKRGEKNGLSYDEFLAALNPFASTYGSDEFYQFALLNEGYSGVSAQVLNQLVASTCNYSESRYGATSKLRDLGDAFIEAARTYEVNEVYLLAHAAWESAWGCSDLAQGWTPTSDGEVIVNGVHYPYHKGTTYYNFFGIGAVDSNALNGGRAMAVKEGWTSPRAAILGAAKWISENYHNRSTARQDTLYLMKFDVGGAAATGSAWHEYCTGLNTWVLGISRIMANGYRLAGYSGMTAPIVYDVVVYGR